MVANGSPYAAAKEDLSTRGNYTAGGLYKPGVRDSTPDYIPNVACIPEPEVTAEERSAIGNKSPYVVLGKSYNVLDDTRNYVERGTASYYGAKFHGRLTSNHAATAQLRPRDQPRQRRVGDRARQRPWPVP
ncbi:hypothetical protein G6F46_014536 [Rhizopus delemar]|nr:hypothetical protein G6F46_014536 [Rhizopus delemar]